VSSVENKVAEDSTASGLAGDRKAALTFPKEGYLAVEVGGELTAAAVVTFLDYVLAYNKRAPGLPFNMRQCITAEAEAQIRLFHASEHPGAPEPSTPMEWFELIVEFKEKMGGDLEQALDAVPPYKAAGAIPASNSQARTQARMRVMQVINDVIKAVASASAESREHPTASSAVTRALLVRLPAPLAEQVRQDQRIGTMGEVQRGTTLKSLTTAVSAHVDIIFASADSKDKAAFNVSVVRPGVGAKSAGASAAASAGAGSAAPGASAGSTYHKGGGRVEPGGYKKAAQFKAADAAAAPAGGAGGAAPGRRSGVSGGAAAAGAGAAFSDKTCANCSLTGHKWRECNLDCRHGFACKFRELTGDKRCNLRHVKK